MLHQEFAKLLPLGDQEEQRLVDLPRREVDGPNEALGAGRDVELLLVAIRRQDMKLPRLPTVQQPQTIGLDGDLVQIRDADSANVLLDPRILNRARIDAKQPLGKVPEWPGRLL